MASRNIRADIPIILCASYGEIVDEIEAKNLGLTDFLMKPVSRQNLSEIIRSVLNHSTKNI